MDEFFKMDIFFVVATAAVFLGMVLCGVAMLYIIKILKSVDNITKNVSEESDEMRGDIAVLRSKIRQEGVKFRHFSDFFANIVSRRKSRKKSE